MFSFMSRPQTVFIFTPTPKIPHICPKNLKTTANVILNVRIKGKIEKKSRSAI